MVYAPSPLPWVPGSGSELRPRHPPQLVSKHKHEMASAADNMRLTVYLRGAPVRPPAPSSPAAPRGGQWTGPQSARGDPRAPATLAARPVDVRLRAAGHLSRPAAVRAG